jgi:hypothetical protein
MSRNHRLLFLAPAVAVLLAIAGSADARRRSVDHRPPPVNPLFSQGGYADQTSVVQGSSIRLHISTAISPFSLQIVNLAQPNSVLAARTVTARQQDCSGRFSSGCGWDVTTTFDIPLSWRSGYYAATFPTTMGLRYVPFVVRAANPGSRSRTVIISPTNTYQAYNNFGGRSFYPESLGDPQSPARATQVSFDRPYDQEAGLGRYPLWEKYLVDWMTREGRQFEVLTDSDLEEPTSLSNYSAVIIAGHSEYWTTAARATLEAFSRRGGHLAVLSGSTMWWQVRLSNNKRSLTGFNGAEFDPNFGSADATVTTNWFAHPVNNPENRILATSFRNGGFTNKVDAPNDYSLKPLDQRTPWTVTNASHWVFVGTGLTNGQTFGREIAGLEVDGVLFNCDIAGRVSGAEGSDEAPLNYHILAVIPASNGWGTMGFYVNSAGGGVFNAATQGWVWALEGSGVVTRMTANILDRFSSGAPFAYDPVQSAVLAEDRFNCPQGNITAPGWRSAGPRGSVTSSCAYEGPAGLELAGGQAIAMARNFSPTGQSRDHVDIRFYLKADDVQQRTQHPMAVVSVRNRTATTSEQVALVELDASTGARRIRVARRGPDGFAAAPEWITLANGWHLIELTWRSPGLIQLQVDGGTPLTLNNPHAGQRANEMVLELPAPQTSSSGRVCIDAIAAGSQKLGSVPGLR